MKKNILSVLFFFVCITSMWGKTFYAQGPNGKKALALTFDDGPGPWTTPILDILDQAGVKATFFMNGDQVEMRPSIAREVKKRGHEIGDHTYSHMNFYAYEKKWGLEKTKEKISSEIQKSRSLLRKISGIDPPLCRMPHGYNRVWLSELAQKFNLTFINWTFGEDWQKKTKEEMLKDYLAQVRSGAILLFHDGGKNREKTAAILPQVIQEAKKKGLALVTVSELLGL